MEDGNSPKGKMNEEELILDTGAFWKYVRSAGNTCILVILGSILLLTQVASSGTDYWLSYWLV